VAPPGAALDLSRRFCHDRGVTQFLLVVAVALTVGAVVFGITMLVTGEDQGLRPIEPDGRAVPLPGDRPLAEPDLAEVRFDTALRGYRMTQVDAALRRAAYDIGYKDELVKVLQAEVDALREGRLPDAEVLRRAREAALAPLQPAAAPPAGPEPAGPEPAGPESAGPEPAGPEPAGPEPAGPEPAGPESAGPEPAGPEPAGPEPGGFDESAGATGSLALGAGTELAGDPATGVRPAGDEPAPEPAAAPDSAEAAASAQPAETAQPAGGGSGPAACSASDSSLSGSR